MKDWHDEEMPGEGKAGATVWYEFECPKCDAHNPAEDGFKLRDEIFCFYCGASFKVAERDGKLRLKDA